MLISNTTLRDFRMIVATVPCEGGHIALSTADQQALGCHAGESVRTLLLNPRKNINV